MSGKNSVHGDKLRKMAYRGARGVALIGQRLASRLSREPGRVTAGAALADLAAKTDCGQSLGIVVTTFQPRLWAQAFPLLRNIEEAGLGSRATVILNGNLDGPCDPTIRRQFEESVAKELSASVVSLRYMHGMAHNWNLGLRLAECDVTMVLSDDVLLDPEVFSDEFHRVCQVASDRGLCIVNGSFAHFAISAEALCALGPFDERFVGFGEEDGDYVWRFKKETGEDPPGFKMESLLHLNDQSRGEEAPGNGKYSLANRLALERKYSMGSGDIRGMFNVVAERRLSRFLSCLDPRQARLARDILRANDEIEITELLDQLEVSAWREDRT